MYEFSMRTDFGITNLSIAGGWFCHNLIKKYGKNNIKITWQNNNAFGSYIDRLCNKHADMVFATPVEMVEQAVKGIGMYDHCEPNDNFRAIFSLAHSDEHVMAVRKESNLFSFDDIFDPKGPVTLITANRINDTLMGRTLIEMFNLYGGYEKWVEKGGKLITHDSPYKVLEYMNQGLGDAIWFEAFMLKPWWDLCEKYDLRFIDLDEHLIEPMIKMGNKVKWRQPDGKKGFDKPVRCLDYSHWVLLCRPDFDSELVTAITEAAIEHIPEFERDYLEEERRYSCVTLPITPTKLADVGDVPLHPAAEAVYRARGVIK